MTARLVDMADGLIAVLDERLGPPGSSVAEHYVQVARLLMEAESALASLDSTPGPFDVSDPSIRRSEASYALLESARALMGLAVRLRSRFTAQHAKRAAEPLRMGLRALAADAPDGDPREHLLSAAHALVVVAHPVEVADKARDASVVGPGLDDAIQHLIAHGVLPILQLAVMVQDEELP